jgi:hypothetical protein
MSRMNHRSRHRKTPMPDTGLGFGPYKRGILWAELRARKQDEVSESRCKRLDGRDPFDQASENRAEP